MRAFCVNLFILDGFFEGNREFVLIHSELLLLWLQAQDVGLEASLNLLVKEFVEDLNAMLLQRLYVVERDSSDLVDIEETG